MLWKVVLASISGAALALNFNFPHFFIFPFISLIPYFFFSQEKLKRAVFLSFLFGISFNFSALFWVGEVSRLGCFFLGIYLSLYCILFLAGLRLFLNRGFYFLTVPAFWVVVEFLKENLLGGFGWLNLGYSQFKNLYFIQAADIFGVKFISFIIVMVNVVIFSSLKKKKLDKIPFLFLSLVILGCFLYSYFKLNSKNTSSYLSVSLIQPNIPQSIKWQMQKRDFIINRLKTLLKEVEGDSLVIFPESAWPYILNKKNEIQLKEFSFLVKRDFLMGAIKEEDQGIYNTALLYSGGGNLLGEYRKVKLVPFGEYVPFRKFLSFIPIINIIGDMQAAKTGVLFFYKDKIFSSLICFEDVFPFYVAKLSRYAHFLVNITNDAWFGGNPQSRQHLSIMVFRAIENGLTIIRCANTGISGWVSYKGKIDKLTEDSKDVFFSGVGNFKVSLVKKRTFYNRYPEAFSFFCGIFLVGFMIFTGKGSRVLKP